MKKVLFAALILMAGCKKEEVKQSDSSNLSVTTITCTAIAEKIEEAKSGGNKIEVYSYEYKGKTVYLFDTCIGCADNMTIVYDCDGKTLCQFGGIAGFNTCPDFEKTAGNKKLVYKAP
ncbi:hypothetical protein SAMN04515674_112105 [Pseudarcicella hirudinis]|uniref:DUF6970 domain-containing protein n=1 Tax=Pseudarcicella hirudinis TaxID=1079859 RepID=A0A1I5WQJ0_9BACT|nr:hypothetical protein [Pseudarcicella hirudinis]SFQ21851.1 hypothetical protein SAMN04515674_112105 [Pseudarcicella hirudinis]